MLKCSESVPVFQTFYLNVQYLISLNQYNENKSSLLMPWSSVGSWELLSSDLSDMTDVLVTSADLVPHSQSVLFIVLTHNNSYLMRLYV